MEELSDEELRDPRFSWATAVHDWRNYVSDELRAIWDTFTDEQRRVLHRCFDAMAEAEEWE